MRKLQWVRNGIAVLAVVGIAAGTNIVTARGAAADPPARDIDVNLDVGGPSQVGAVGFPVDTEVRMRVDFGNDGGPIDGYDYDQTVPSTGEFVFGFDLGSTYLQPGDHVLMTGDGTTKELFVAGLRIEKADPVTDVVGGVAPANSFVDVDVAQPNNAPGPPIADLQTQADGDGKWSMDFSGVTDGDFDEGRNIDAYVADADGDRTHDGWNALVPHIYVNLDEGGPSQVGVVGMPVGTEVRMQVDFGNDGGLIDGWDYDNTQASTSQFGFPFDLGADRVQPGDHILMTGGGWTKELFVDLIRLERADPATDQVSGIAPPDSFVDVDLAQPNNGPGPPVAHLQTQADGDGNWSVDFSGETDGDFETGRSVDAFVADEDGDRTHSGLNAEQAYISADLTPGPPSQVEVHGIPTGTSVRVQVDYGNNGGPLPGAWDFDQEQLSSNPFSFSFDLGGSGLLHPGDQILMTGGGWTKELILDNLTTTSLSVALNVVSGLADPGVTVDAYLNPPPGENGPPVADLTATASDPGGNWSVDFSPYDVVPNQSGYVVTPPDPDGDETHAMFFAEAPPAFLDVTPDTNLVQGQMVSLSGANWPAGKPLFVTQCDTTVPLGINSCDGSTQQAFPVAGDGTVSGQYKVNRSIITAQTGAVDCASSLNRCGLVGVVWHGAINDIGAGLTLDFPQNNPINFAPTADRIVPTIKFSSPVALASIPEHKLVKASYSCSDTGGSGLASCVGTFANGSPIDTTTLGVHVFTVIGRDRAGNVAVVSHFYQVVDVTPPSVAINIPTNGATFARGSTVNADYSCFDAGSGIKICGGSAATGTPVDTTTIGTKSFTVTAVDNANNTTKITIKYKVVYPWLGFWVPFQYLDDPPSVYPDGTAGQKMNLAFGLGFDGLSGYEGLPVTSGGKWTQVDCTTGALIGTSTAATMSVSYTNVPEKYIISMPTKAAWAGTCRQFQLTLKDGTTHAVNFQF